MTDHMKGRTITGDIEVTPLMTSLMNGAPATDAPATLYQEIVKDTTQGKAEEAESRMGLQEKITLIDTVIIGWSTSSIGAEHPQQEEKENR